MKNKGFKTKSPKAKSNSKKFKNKKDLSKKSPVKESEEDLDFDDIEKAYDEFEDSDFEDLEGEEANAEIELKLKNEEGTEGDDDDEMEDDDEEEEDEEDKQFSQQSGKITEQSLKKLEAELSANSTAISAFKQIQNALDAAVSSIKDGDGKDKGQKIEIKEPRIFNMIVRLCLTKIPTTLHRLCELKTLSDRPVRNKKWIKLASSLRKYLKNIILLIKSISEPSMIEKILKKGLLPLLPFYAEFPNLSWPLTKQIATLWCTSEEKVRVLSVIALFRLMTSFREDKKEKVLKLLYVSYVKNCRFTSPSSWPLIDFMRMSLAELYSMDQALAYRHAFIYIKQLASHLRNAMLIQKKERTQLVYNWQFVHCLRFWSELLTKTYPSPILGPLIYPVIQISHGMLTLIKSPSYFPLTFHISDMLTELSEKTGIFIPVLPYLMEVLLSQRIRKRPHKKSGKPLEWNCAIKVSKAQLDETSFVDGLVEQIFSSSVKYLNSQSNSIGFTELVFPFTLQLKAFLKKCKIPTYTRKIKQLSDKIKENSEFIDSRRRNVTFKISDEEAIRNWEIEVGQNPPPFRAFYNQWTEMNNALRKRQREDEEENEGEDEREGKREKVFKKRKLNKKPRINNVKNRK